LAFADGSGARRRFGASVVPLAWEVTNFRGADGSIADVRVLLCGEREIVFGEGLVTQVCFLFRLVFF
jgi:hypothetical protein